MIRVLLVDDQLCVRIGLQMRLTLESDLVVVGQAATSREAVQQAERLQPDVVLMDVQLPDHDGISTAETLARRAPRCAVVILSLDDCSETRQRAQLAGVVACISKQADDLALIAAIRAASQPR